ncbi:hypothetical protein ACQ4PT_059607 [Festuca glaucescens]
MVAKLETTLREACVLVSSCQASSYFRRFIRSGKQAEQFQRIKDKIDFYLQLFPVISHIDTTRRLNILLDGVESPQTQQAWDLVFVEKTLWKLLVHPSLCSEALRRMDQNHQIRRCAHIALVCVQEDPADRPSMWEVVLMLSTTARLETPKKPVRQYGSEPRSGDILRDTRDWYKKTITVVLRQVT